MAQMHPIPRRWDAGKATRSLRTGASLEVGAPVRDTGSSRSTGANAAAVAVGG